MSSQFYFSHATGSIHTGVLRFCPDVKSNGSLMDGEACALIWADGTNTACRVHISFLCKNRVNNRGRRKSFHVLKQEAQGERQDSTKQPPLGYWLKHADEVITKHANHVLSEQSFTRFHSSIMNILKT